MNKLGRFIFTTVFMIVTSVGYSAVPCRDGGVCDDGKFCHGGECCTLPEGAGTCVPQKK